MNGIIEAAQERLHSAAISWQKAKAETHTVDGYRAFCAAEDSLDRATTELSHAFEAYLKWKGSI